MAIPKDDSDITRLVISNGDLPGLVAAMIASEDTVRRDTVHAGHPVVWAGTAQGAKAAERQASSLGLRTIRRKPGVSAPSGSPDESLRTGEGANRLLMDAATAALSLRCPLVVWPVLPAGPASAEPALVELIAAAVSRATLVSRLVSLDAPMVGLPEIRIETPFVDLTDQQLADLACDLGVRFEECWWWSIDSSAASEERARWGPLLPVSA